MQRIPFRFKTSVLAALICVIAGIPQGVQAAPPAPGTINLLTTPPELTSKVAPNVVLTFDDSGSMNWQHMPDNRPYTDVDWGAGNGQTEATNSTWPAGSGPYFCAGVIDPTLPADPANPRTWAMNGVYYNPRASYRPPMLADGSSLPNSPFSRAWVNGIKNNRPVNPSTSTVYNLGTNTTAQGRRFCGNTAGWYQLKTGVVLTLDGLGRIDAASLGRLYTATNWEWVPLPADPDQQQNFANWFSYYHTRTLAAMSATSIAFSEFDQGIRVAWQNINSNSTSGTNVPWIAKNVTTLAPFSGTVRTKFYDWMLGNPASGNTPNQAAAKRVGELFTGGASVSNAKNPYWDVDTGRELSCRKNFHIQMTDGMWNNATVPVAQKDTVAIPTLPDGRSYVITEPQSKIFWNDLSGAQETMGDIGFSYWATDLRPDFQGNPQTKLKVRPYLVDRTTGVTGSVPLQPGDNWLDNKELYWNPANDPATWPHLVQYMIGFGVSGTIPKNDANMLRLRQGLIAWPKLDGSAPTYTDNNKKIDDMWHAAINSRGMFFAASSPDDLIEALRKIIASVTAQSSASTPAAVSLPILTGGNSAYQGSYDSGSWSGSVIRSMLDAAGQPQTSLWDASCRLTGGNCADPVGTNPVRDPASRLILTSDGATTGKLFEYTSLTTAQQNALSQKPATSTPCTGGSDPNCDAYGPLRVDYLRGQRTNEPAASVPQFRARTSVLGAVINGEPAYVSSPRSGYHDMFPIGSPEQVAAAGDEQDSYAGYQNAQRSRQPMLYVGANDGMLHAFDAATGDEKWAFVPNTLISNGRLVASTRADASLVTGVDSRPRERDVFIKGKWRTVLLGSLRLGGRGVYALDVTNPAPTQSDALGSDGLVLWEFNNGPDPSAAGDPPACSAGATSCASLGYTYDSMNVMRIRHDNKWVAVVSSGYFPSNVDAAANPQDRLEAAASRTSLLVIDLETGKLIKELRTSEAPQSKPTGFKTFGLSTPMVYDEGSDEIDDLAYAGDLAGNLWRFNLSADDPDDWSVDLMFTTYGSGGAATAGDQPIVFNPSALRDPVTRRAILIVGTGKYLGEDDRTSLIPQQAFYGIRDYGTNSPVYPIRVNELVTQNLSEASDETRSVTGWTSPSATMPSTTPPLRLGSVDAFGKPVVTSVQANGWRMPLNIAAEKGERAQRRAIPVPSANVAFLYGLIPKSDDPCDPGARYSIMALDAATGAAITTSGGIGSGQGLVGGVVSSPSPPSDPVVKRGGGGAVLIGIPAGTPLVVVEAINKIMNAAIPPWHRGAWRELLDW